MRVANFGVQPSMGGGAVVVNVNGELQQGEAVGLLHSCEQLDRPDANHRPHDSTKCSSWCQLTVVRCTFTTSFFELARITQRTPRPRLVVM